MSIAKNLFSLFTFFPAKLKIRILFTISISLLASLSESILLLSIIPFLSSIAGINTSLSYLPSLFLQIIPFDDRIVYLLVFIVLNLLSAASRIFSSYLNSSIASSTGQYLGSFIFSKYIYYPLEDPLSINSSDFISLISFKLNQTVVALDCLFQFFTSFCVSIVIVSTLLLQEPILSISMVLSIGTFYVFLLYIIKPYLSRNSRNIADSSSQLIRLSQDVGFLRRDIFSMRNHGFFLQHFDYLNKLVRTKSSLNIFLASAPRFIVELVAICLLAILSSIFFRNQSADLILSNLGFFALGLQRLLPSLQQLFSLFSRILSYRSSLSDISNFVDSELPTFEFSKLNDSTFDGLVISFLDHTSSQLFNNFKYHSSESICLRPGEFVGLIGGSGSGKSSFLDSLCNFTSTANLKININGVDVDPLKTSLPIRLAYVHQHSTLLDGTIRSNIVMSNSFNLEKMNTILNLVSLSGWVDSLPLGIDTYVGERGTNISGGQVQRICLARALYSEPQLLVLDEVTSALDPHTKTTIMNNLQSILSCTTIVMVTHDHSKLNLFSKVFQFDNFVISRIV